MVTRHNNHVLVETCHIAHLSVKVEMGSNLTSDHDHSCPEDILLTNWALGKPAAFDISVTSLLNPKTVPVAALSVGAAAMSTEEHKHALGWYCLSLVADPMGAMDSFKMLASRLDIISGKIKKISLMKISS